MCEDNFIFLRGRVKFPIGGKQFIVSPRANLAGSGAIPEPTVKVWMEEGVVTLVWKFVFPDVYFTIVFSVTKPLEGVYF